MSSRSVTILLIFAITFSVLITSSIAKLVTAQGENKTNNVDNNNTRRIINLVNNTITIVDKTTNETISTMPYIANAGNDTSNSTLNNESFPTNKENSTTDDLSQKFNSLNK